jgi:DNA-binding CsgD family transcriptional regulator
VEAGRVEALIGAAMAGESGSLLVSGEPGIGKTLLLAHARTVAEDEGALLLEAAGAEGEAHLAFAGLSDLVRPVLGRLDELPAPQADALRGALALGPTAPGDRFTTYAATLSLLAAAAEERPALCILDDAHWLDAESFEAVQFASRRLGAEGVVVLMGARDGLSSRVDAWPLERLRLGALGGADAAALVTEHAPVVPSPGVLDALVAGAKGNPLALIELGRALSPDQLAGAEPLPDPLPVGPYLQDALLRPVRALPEPTRRALVVLSADDGAAGFLPAALAAEGLATTDLEPAERAGVIAIGPTRALFSHPLVRAAVYQGADATGRRSAHRAHAASATAAGESALDRRAWHLALAATGPDESVAAELEAAGGRAAARNGHAAACEAFETAGRLSPVAAERGRRLLAAAQSALAAGDFTRAGRLFDEVAALDADPGQAQAAMAGRGYVETFAGSARRAVDLLVGAADRAQMASPAAAASLLVQAMIPATMRGELGQALSLAERASPLCASGSPALAAQREVAESIIRAFIGRPRQPKAESVAELAGPVAAQDPTSVVWLIGSFQALMFTERYDEARAGLDLLVRTARERSTPSVLPLALFTRAELSRRVGRLDEALVDATECVQIAEDTGQDSNAAIGRWTLARIQAVRGHGLESRMQVEHMLAAIGTSEASNIPSYADEALGLLALGEGRHDDAAEHLGAAERRYREQAVRPGPVTDAYAQDLVEALIRVGRLAEAEECLADVEGYVARGSALWLAAVAARCRGLLAADAEFEQHFAAALELHGRTTAPFERARTELCLGERRRRARRARDARGPLMSALATFEVLGAAPWADRARRELRAAGARPRAARAPTTESLTPQELQIALAVSEGSTNKEVAAALLISPKTVEYHLGKVYEKLGVRSRAELATRIARRDVSLAGMD